MLKLYCFYTLLCLLPNTSTPTQLFAKSYCSIALTIMDLEIYGPIEVGFYGKK